MGRNERHPSGEKRAGVLREAYRLIDTPDQRLTVLTNGLTAILARNAAADVAAVRVYIRAGSIYEGRWAGTGISHLLEHVITGDGTARHSEAELLSLGESLGGLVNAYTAVDHICHHVTVSPEHIPHAIEMFADYVTGPRLSQAVFERERIVVLRELEQDRDDPEAQLEEMLSGILYRGHPLAYPVIGRREGVAALTREDLLNYYRQTHVPDGVVVVIAGDLDPDATARTILETFKTWQWRPSPAIRGPALLPVLSRIRARRRMPVASAAATIGWRTVREGTVDDAALDLLGLVLGAGDDARLVKSLRWDRGLVHEVSASHDSTWHTPGTFQIDVRCDVARLETVEEAVLEEIERLEHAPITAAELQRAKQRVRVDVLYPSETAEGLAAQLGEDFLATGSVGYTEAYLASVRAASTDDLLRAARRHLRPDRFVSAAIVPESTRVLMSSAETRFAAKTDRSELNPALVCLVRPMAWSSFVAVNVLWPGGLSAETEETNGVFNLMARMMLRGAGGRRADEIAAMFASHGSSLGVEVGLDHIGARFVAPTEALEELLQMMATVLRKPDFPAAELERCKPPILDAISRIDEQWDGELTRFSRGRFFAGRPYGRTWLGTASTVSRLTVEDLRSAHRRLWNGARCVVSIAGRVDASRARDAVARLFGDAGGFNVPGRSCAQGRSEDDAIRDGTCSGLGASAFETPARDRLFVKRVSVERDVAGLFVGFPGLSLLEGSGRAAVAVMETLLAGYALSGGRLYSALRGGDRDLVYEVSGAGLSGLLEGCIAFAAACAPDRLETVYRIVREEIASLRAGALDQVELEGARRGVWMGERDQLQTPADWAMRLGLDELVGLGIRDWERFRDEVGRVSRDDVIAAARRHLQHATVAIVTPKPETVNLGHKPSVSAEDAG